MSSLEARSRRPHRLRQPQTPPIVVRRLRHLRQQYPRWGREKLRILLRRDGLTVSAKTIDRVLHRLRQQGLLLEPRRQPISSHKRHLVRPYALRKPRDYAVTDPLVQLDTLDIRPLPGLILKQFTAHDVVSRWDVIETYTGRPP